MGFFHSGVAFFAIGCLQISVEVIKCVFGVLARDMKKDISCVTAEGKSSSAFG
jgi:hypothetical protein